MATEVFDNAFLSLGGTDISDHIQQINLSYSKAELTETAMSDASVVRKGGLADWSISVTWIQDFAAGEVDATIWPLVGTTFAVVFRPDAGAKATANPEWTGTGFLPEYNFGGSVGDLLTASTTINASSDLTRATS